MNLFVIRHADAGSRSDWDGDDADRPLSDLGRHQARALGEAFRRHALTVDAIVCSPLVRTRQTAEEFADAWTTAPTTHYTDLLAPDGLKKRKLMKLIASLEAENVAVVGHDPELPALLGWLIGCDRDHVPLEKGGAALVQFDDAPGKGDGRLGWVVTPDWVMAGTPAGV